MDNPEGPAETVDDAPAPTRVCPNCAALSRTSGDFCPHCGEPFSGKRGRKGRYRPSKYVVAAIVALLALGAAATVGVIKVQHDRDAQARRAAKAKQAAEQSRRDAAVRAKQAETAQQIAQRHKAERAMEKSITKWARKEVTKGTLTGSIKRTSCTPIGGGSENLADVTVKYDCLAVTTYNSDGTWEGYTVHATMDFSDGSYTWGLGSG